MVGIKTKIALIGAGNVATQLALTLHANAWEITDIYSRNITNAIRLASKINAAKPVDSLDFKESSANLFIVAIPDHAVEEVVAQAVFPKASFVVHTSGSLSVDVLKQSGLPVGVFYPLQTFSLDKLIDFSVIPICVETDQISKDSSQQLLLKNILIKLANSISKHVYELGSGDRQYLHLAAVFACNFTNHLIGVSEDVLSQRNLTIDLLKPLVLETFQKAFEIGAKRAQTGPAQRDDQNVIQKQISLLEEKPILQEIYKVLTHSIIQKKAL